MKKHYLLLLMATGLVQASFAQMPITANNLNIIGDVTTIAICGNDVVNAGPSGADQVWDMSSLIETEEQDFQFVNPEDTYWGYEFPASTICGVSWNGEHSYYRFDEEGVSVEGYAGLIIGENPTDTFKIIHDNPESFIPIPFEYEDMQNDDFSGSSQVMDFNIPFTGDVEFEADGYGTLILPTGTYENVVRYHFNRTQINQVGVGTTTQTKEQWGWISPDHRFWLMIQEIVNDGVSDSQLIWYHKDPLPAIVTGIADVHESNLSLYPNPSKFNQTVYLEWDMNERAHIIATSISGKQVFNRQMNLTAGMNVLDLDHAHLTEGVYVVQVITDRGISNSKWVLNR